MTDEATPNMTLQSSTTDSQTSTLSKRDRPATSADIRSHLANERTFLAWARTGMTAVALGLGAVQLLDANEIAGVPLSKIIAFSLVAFGLSCVVIGRLRYRRSAMGILDEDFQPYRHGLELVVLGMTIVTGFAIAYVLRW